MAAALPVAIDRFDAFLEQKLDDLRRALQAEHCSAVQLALAANGNRDAGDLSQFPRPPASMPRPPPSSGQQPTTIQVFESDLCEEVELDSDQHLPETPAGCWGGAPQHPPQHMHNPPALNPQPPCMHSPPGLESMHSPPAVFHSPPAAANWNNARRDSNDSLQEATWTQPFNNAGSRRGSFLDQGGLFQDPVSAAITGSRRGSWRAPDQGDVDGGPRRSSFVQGPSSMGNQVLERLDVMANSGQGRRNSHIRSKSPSSEPPPPPVPGFEVSFVGALPDMPKGGRSSKGRKGQDTASTADTLVLGGGKNRDASRGTNSPGRKGASKDGADDAEYPSSGDNEELKHSISATSGRSGNPKLRKQATGELQQKEGKKQLMAAIAGRRDSNMSKQSRGDALKEKMGNFLGIGVSSTSTQPPDKAEDESSSSEDGEDGEGAPAISTSEGEGERRRSVESDDHEVEEYVINAIWTVDRKSRESRRTGHAITRNTTQAFKDLTDLAESMEGSWVKYVIIHPQSAKRLFWDLLGMLLIAFDIIYIPLMVFDPPENSALLSMPWISRIFWTIDFCTNFFTAYVLDNGEQEDRILLVALHYITTWAPLDLVVVIFEWLEVAMEDFFRWHTLAKVVRAQQGLRILRVLRVVRVSSRLSALSSEIVAQIQQSFRSYEEELMIVLDIFKIMIMIALVVHLTACMWYGITTNTTNSWLETEGLREASLGHRYVATFHWALAQFTGADSIAPSNHIERALAVVIIFFAYIVSAFIVSSITSSMTRLQIISASMAKQFSVLSRYLIDHGISAALASRIKRNAKHFVAEQRRNTPESSVDLLAIISKPLRVELDYEVYCPVLQKHPFFKIYSARCPAGMRQVCYGAVQRLFLTQDDVLFSDGEIPQKPMMFFVIRGSLRYKRKGHTTRTLHEGEWAGEHALWPLHWNHHGAIIAETEVSLLCLLAEEFQKIARQFMQTNTLNVNFYAQEFVKEMNKWKDHEVSEVFSADDHVGTIDVENIAKAMIERS